MSYQKKYYYTFRDLENKKFTVEILEDTEDTLTAEEVRGGDNPFTIDYPTINHLFQPVIGSGAEFNLLSTSNMKFVNLATGDMFKYQIRLIEEVWITPVVSQDIVKWLGYINSEMYEEPFNSIDNYQVNFTANDGFNLLDRIMYSSEIDGSRIDTIGSNFITLFNIFYRIGLPYDKLYVGLSSTIDGITIDADKTTFHYLYTNPDNFYNEDGEPETYRTVLEKILEPLGAYIFAFEGNIYITDNNYILTDSGSTRDFKIFNMQDSFNYLGTQLIDINIGDLSTIGFANTSQTYTIIPAINKQVVNYNRYRITSPFNYDAKDDVYTGTTTYNVGGNTTYNYTQYTSTSGKTWNAHNGATFIEMVGAGTKNQNTNIKGLYLNYQNDGYTINENTLQFTYKSDLPYFIQSEDYKLKLDLTIYPQTWINIGITPNTPEQPNESKLVEVQLQMEVIIGDKKYVQTGELFEQTGSWQDVTDTTDSTYILSKPVGKWYVTNPLPIEFNDYEAINDTPVELRDWKLGSPQGTTNTYSEAVDTDFIIPLNTEFSDRLEIKIYGYRWILADGTTGTTVDGFGKNIITEIEVTIIDKYNEDVKKMDFEIVGDSKNSPLQPIYKEEGNEVKLYCGTNSEKYPCENGNILILSGTTYIPLQTITRQGVTDSPEYLLLRSIVSNYYTPSIQLNVTTNRMEKMLGYLTYNNYLSGKKFRITGMKRNVGESSDEITIQEFSEDDVTIEKV